MQVFAHLYVFDLGSLFNKVRVKNMSKTTYKQIPVDEYLDKLKENYILRVQEFDNFCKHMSNACVDVSNEFLYGSLNTIQHFIDLQKKYSSKFTPWYDQNLMIKQSKLITESWIQTLQNIDSFYIELQNHTKGNLRTINKSAVQFIQDFEKFYDIYQDMLPNQETKAESDSQIKPNISKKES